jgi:hypothetical protein
MEQLLAEYIEKMQPLGKGIDERTGHMIASLLIAFRTGIYERAVERADEVLKRLEAAVDTPEVVIKAVSILRENAKDLVGSSVKIRSEFTFAGEGTDQYRSVRSERSAEFHFEDLETEYLAIQITGESTEVREAFDRDNALLLLYAVSIIASPYDEQSLEEQLQRLLLHRLKYYLKKA